MQALLFYITYPFIYAVASLPYGALYRLSDVFCFFVRLIGYRKEVIFKNLRTSFPDKTEREISKLARDYYRYFCDLTLETLKTLRMPEDESRDRVTLENVELFHKLHRENKSVILVLGHYGNWEWIGPCVTLHTPYQLNVIYRPLTNPYFERMMVRMRTRFGTRITPVPQTLRDMVATRGTVTATAFVADQAAPVNAYWTTFLNQDTSVFTGPEKLATKFNYPVVYLHVERPKRGYYTVRPELLFETPAQTQPDEISEKFTRRLEKDIITYPPIWLWSHKRWKHARPTA
ncbi:MAG: lysophospholipid acyltransferase family protein [Cytophagales bacterium]|nr:lysophospholipid acyltransferase family protein [Cytophagales bacterium]